MGEISNGPWLLKLSASGRRLQFLKSLEISLIWGLLVKGGVAPLPVVESEPDWEVTGQLRPCLVRFQVDALVLQGAPEPFDEDVVFEAPFAVHADFHVPRLEDRSEHLAGKLAALVGVEDLGRAVLEESLLQCLDAKPSVESVGQAPGEDFPRGPVHDGDQVHKALVHWDVGDVSCPDLVRTIDSNAAKIGINRVFRLPSACSWLRCQGFDAHDEHQSSDPIATDRSF